MACPIPGVLTEEPPAEDYELKLTYRARSSKGVRFQPGEGSVAGDCRRMLEEFNRSPIELIEPLDAAVRRGEPADHAHDRGLPVAERAPSRAHPVTRYGLMVLETLDAVDPAYESVAICLLDGDARFAAATRTSPASSARSPSYWDEVTGDQMVRGIVGWGGRGVRGDTERTATRFLSGILVAIVSAAGRRRGRRAGAAAATRSGSGLVCPHCQFAQVGRSAFFCPKCGMRLLRG